MAYIPGQNCNATALEIRNQKRRKETYEKKLNNYLKELGKFSAFLEKFDHIPLEVQELPKIETVDDIKVNEHFIKGREFGFTLIANGFDIEKFNQYRMDRETKKAQIRR